MFIHFGTHVGAMLTQFGVILGGVFDPPPFFFGRSRYLLACRYCCHRVPDSQGRRVPALALTISEDDARYDLVQLLFRFI